MSETSDNSKIAAVSASNIPNSPRTEVINSEEDRYDRKNSKSLAKRERKALSYTNQRITTRAQLKDYIMDTLGYPLQTVELTDEQLEDCIDDATQLYTKWATLPEKYITMPLSAYQRGDEDSGEEEGLDLSDYNVACVDTIGGQDSFGMFGADGLWGLSNCMLATGTYPFLGRSFGGSSFEGFTTYQCAYEFCALARRLCGHEFTFDFNPQTQMLVLIPNPALQPEKFRDTIVVFKCECVPEDRLLYGNNFVKRLAVAYAKIRLGTIRSKFAGVSFGGGITVNAAIGDEGRAEIADLIERIKKEEAIGTGFLIG